MQVTRIYIEIRVNSMSLYDLFLITISVILHAMIDVAAFESYS